MQCQLEIMTAAPVSADWPEPDVPAAPASAAPIEPDLPTAPASAAPIEPDLPAAPASAAPIEPDLPAAPVGPAPAEPDAPAAPAVEGPFPTTSASEGGAEPNEPLVTEAALWWAYRRTGDVGLRNRLVMHHGPWAEARTRRFARARGFDWREVWGAAALGLIEAVERFDPAGGVPFRAYAVHRIQGALFDASRERYDHDFVVRSFTSGSGETAASADMQVGRVRCEAARNIPADHTSQAPPDLAMHRSVESRVLGCMPDERSREIARRRFCLLQSVDEIAHYMVVEKSRVEEIMREVVLPRARRLCVKLGIRPGRRASGIE